MPKTLVVVESPAKAKTIEKYLGGDYAVRASYGHIRDLRKVEPGRGRRSRLLARLRGPRGLQDARGRAEVGPQGRRRLVPGDGLRPGGRGHRVPRRLPAGPGSRLANRVTFTEITRDAILEAFQHPRAIDLKLFDAQEARRILDRLVGLQDLAAACGSGSARASRRGACSPWPSASSWSASARSGAFNPVEYWSVDVRLTPQDDGAAFLARLVEVPEGRLAASPDKKGILLWAPRPTPPRTWSGSARGHYRVLNGRAQGAQALARAARSRPRPCSRRRRASSASPRARRCRPRSGCTRASTCPGEGSVGLITYMRTDSLTIADTALREIAELVKSEYGQPYTLPEPRRYKTKSRNAQEAHEAIRPLQRDAHAPAHRHRSRPRPAAPLHADLAADHGHADGRGALQPGGRGYRSGGRRGPLRAARHRPDDDLRRLPPRLQGGPRRGAGRGRREDAARAHGRAGAAHAGGPARAALHAAAAAIQRGVVGEDARGARHRPALHLRLDHRHHPGPRVRDSGGQAVPPRRTSERSSRTSSSSTSPTWWT